MAAQSSSRRAQSVAYLAIGAMGLLSAARVVDAGDVPLTTIAVTGLAAAVLAGPAAWLARDRYDEDRRETLALVGFGIAMLAVPVGLGLVLLFEVPLVRSFDGAVIGGVAGVLLVALAERTVVPERLRGEGA